MLTHSGEAFDQASGEAFPANALVNPRRLRLIFSDPKLRPPVLHEMQSDIDRLAASIARTRSDQSCFALSVEDLIAEQHFKLASLITKNRIETLPTRFEAFKFIKTVFNNHVKSLVSKYRMTLKRGAKRLPDEEGGEEQEISLNSPTKNTDLSADDPDQHMQIADPTSGWTAEDNFIRDIAGYLSPIELMVLKEYNEPSERTRFYAELDAAVGRKPGSGRQAITFSEKNHADGIGIEPAQFKKILISLRKKIAWHRMNESSTQEIAWNRAITRLEELLNVEVPRSVEKPVIRRLVTVAAVDQFEKIENNQQARMDIEIIGAKVPERKAGIASCYGILYNRNVRACAACGLGRACREEAANYGLGDITIDDRLLGAKQYRVPVVVANAPEPMPLQSPRDEEVYNFLRETFKPQLGVGEWIFRHKETNQVMVIMQQTPTVEIRFQRPSQSIQDELEKKGQHWVVPADMSAADAITLLTDHAHDTFIASAAATV